MADERAALGKNEAKRDEEQKKEREKVKEEEKRKRAMVLLRANPSLIAMLKYKHGLSKKALNIDLS